MKGSRSRREFQQRIRGQNMGCSPMMVKLINLAVFLAGLAVLGKILNWW